VPDQTPPRRAGADESATIRALLQYQRESLLRKIEDISDADAARSPVPSGTTLLWLLQHLAHAEQTWVIVRFAGEDRDLRRQATVAEAAAEYRRTWGRVDAIIDAAPEGLDTPCPPFDDAGDVDLRWILGHLLEETSRHAGHADILRELLDGSTGR
jgi:uncharacterized damage-inducible protein DinB